MNTFILIARHIGTVSGEKIYHCNKLKYMASLRWRTIFLTWKAEDTFFENDCHIECYVLPALTYAPECYSKNEVFKTINKIAELVGDTNNGMCIIESDAVNRALWAELIAKRIHAVHLAFLLQERHPYDQDARHFLEYKYERHELAGITNKSVCQMLNDDEMTVREDAHISAYCNNVVKDCTDSFSGLLAPQAKLTFGSIGRLDKGCVPAILKGFIEYAQGNPSDRFNLVLIGGSMDDKKIQQIQELVSSSNNINLIITGFIYPIPSSLIENIDLFVSTAGSASVSYRFHRPTIKVQPITGEPVSVMGMDDLGEKNMYEILPNTTVYECINRALLNKNNIIYKYDYYYDYYRNMTNEFNRHISIAEWSEKMQKKEYYSDEMLLQIKSTHIKAHSFHRIIGHVIGSKGLNRLVEQLKKIMIL